MQPFKVVKKKKLIKKGIFGVFVLYRNPVTAGLVVGGLEIIPLSLILVNLWVLRSFLHPHF